MLVDLLAYILLSRIASSWQISDELINCPDVIKRISVSVEKIWELCRPIISTQQGDNHKHEISGAFDVLDGNGDDGEGEAAGDGDNQDDVHITILSNCWRAIKEAR